VTAEPVARFGPLAGTDDVVVRRAGIGDVPALVDLLTDDVLGSTREVAEMTPYRRAFAQVDVDPSQLLVVAVADGEVIGTLQLSVIPGLSRAGALRGQIEAVRVRADHRGRGTGAALLRWAIDEARRRGCALVQLTTDKSRADALRWYERLGFVASHEGLKLALDG
jgi:GNAT superfamily N-acetyltransferase